MASPLESAITLDDVFAMVVGKRVPLAPELAGYLSLEIAEKADPAGGEIDPKSVYIADEGTVALVRRREGGGDVEQSIRGVLAQLLDASGSSTPALVAVARRTRVGSLRSLMEELEAALIPVNRAAGRRALARLAREVKRVTLGVGRNASSTRSASGEWTSRGSRPASDEAPTARRDRVLPAAAIPPEKRAKPAPVTAPQMAPSHHPPAVSPVSSPQPPPAAAPPLAHEPAVIVAVTPPPAPSEPPPSTPLFDNPSDVDSLLEQFSRSSSRSDQAVSSDLKDLLEIGATAAPPLVSTVPAAAAADVDALLGLIDDQPRPPPVPMPETSIGLGPAARRAAAISSRPPPAREFPSAPPPSSIPPARLPSLSQRDIPTHQTIPIPSTDWARPKKKRTDYWIVIALLVFIATSAAAIWLLKPGFLSGRTADKVAQEKAAADAAKAKALAAEQAMACRAAVDVTDVPSGAEVLLRVGQAPVDVPRLPVGARLEFVATAEGYAPKRVVIPAGIAWDNGPDGKARFELGVQLDRSNPKVKLGDPWPPGEPGSDVGGKGPPGTVHLISTPKGAELWMLGGLGPEAVIEQLPCDQSVDILVAGPTTYRKRLHAAASDFTSRPGEPSNKLAKLSAR